MFDLEGLIDWDGKVGDVIFDTNGEASPVLFGVKEVINGFDIFWLGVFGGKTITSADDSVDVAAFLGKSGKDIEVERLTFGAVFFGSIKNSDLLDGSWDGFNKKLGVEWAVEMDFDKTDLLAFGIQSVDDFASGFGNGTHSDDDTLGVWIAIVAEWVIFTAGKTAGFGEVFLNNWGDFVEVLVLGFTGLEVDIVVLSATAGDWVGVWVKSAGSELFDFVHADKFLPFLFVDEFDVLDFVGSTETIEEVHDWSLGLDSDEVGDWGKIGDLLDGTRADHGHASLTAGIDVSVVAEDRKGAGS